MFWRTAFGVRCQLGSSPTSPGVGLSARHVVARWSERGGEAASARFDVKRAGREPFELLAPEVGCRLARLLRLFCISFVDAAL